VRALITTRAGGFSAGPYNSMNLGFRVNDDPQAVARNRELLRSYLPEEPRWLHQVHGASVIDAAGWQCEIEADGSFTRVCNQVCAVMIADCMPVLFCDRGATIVAVAHAGWRGLSGGVLEHTIDALSVAPEDLYVYLGPAIGPTAFEVGDDVYRAFTAAQPSAASAFSAQSTGKWLCDLFALARQRLTSRGVHRVFGGADCTYSNPRRFFSHRRDKISGRMAALIWLDGQSQAP
jgi:YfiH family protein